MTEKVGDFSKVFSDNWHIGLGIDGNLLMGLRVMEGSITAFDDHTCPS